MSIPFASADSVMAIVIPLPSSQLATAVHVISSLLPYDVIDFGAAALAGGINGQVGATGKIIFTDGVVYFCTDGAKCTIADSSGWKKAALTWV